jgi:hypothetical protein
MTRITATVIDTVSMASASQVAVPTAHPTDGAACEAMQGGAETGRVRFPGLQLNGS